MTSYKTLDHPALVRALAHPLRARILSVLQERRASPRELADELGAPLGNVSYHVRTLVDLKLIKLVKKVPRRGTIEHYYEAVSGADVGVRVWGETPGVVKQAMVAAALQEVGRTVTHAAALGGFDHPDAHLTRTRLLLDEPAWRELGHQLMEVLERAKQLEVESRARLESSQHEGERATGLIMMMFDQMPSLGALTPDEAQAPGHRVSTRRNERRSSRVRG